MIIYLRDDLGLPWREIARIVYGKTDNKTILKTYGKYWLVKHRKRYLEIQGGYVVTDRYVVTRETQSGNQLDYDYLETDLENLMDHKVHGRLTYNEERKLELKILLRYLYEKYLMEHDTVSQRLWKEIVALNNRFSTKLFPRRPGNQLSGRIIAYFYLLLLNIYLRYGYPWLYNVIRNYLEENNVKSRYVKEIITQTPEIIVF